MLGYGRAANATFSSTYGYVPIPYAYDDVTCEGTETSLEKCQHRDQVATLSYKANIVNYTKFMISIFKVKKSNSETSTTN